MLHANFLYGTFEFYLVVILAPLLLAAVRYLAHKIKRGDF